MTSTRSDTSARLTAAIGQCLWSCPRTVFHDCQVIRRITTVMARR